METGKTKCDRCCGIDIVKVIASVAVVIIHTCLYGLSAYTINSVSWNVCNLWNSFCRWAVPVFFMASGAMLLNPERQSSIAFIWKKRMAKVLRLYVVWSIIYGIAELANWMQRESLQVGMLKSCVIEILNGHYHLWYLIALGGVYALIPLLSGIVKNPAKLKYLLGMGIILEVVVPTFRNVLPMLRMITAQEDIPFRIGYVLYFVLGWHLFNMPIKKWYAYLGLVMFFCGGCTTAILQSVYVEDVVLAWPYEYLSFNVFLEAVGVFLCVRYFCKEWPMQMNGTQKLATAIVDDGLGIYLVHVLVLDLVTKYDVFHWNEKAAVIPLRAIAVFLISLGIVEIIKRIPKISIIVGR